MAAKPEPEKTPWETLSAIDLTDRIEKKNGLSYISWAWAWGELKRLYPFAWYRKHETAAGYPCFHDVQGYAFVKVTVGLDRTGDHEVTELMPVLDHRNKPIQGPNAFDVNNALQRCLTKAIAYHGLGHYIYAGEDVPSDAGATPPQSAGEARTAPVGGQEVSAPPTDTAPVPQPPPGMSDPIHIYDHAGAAHWVEKRADIMLVTMIGFIPFCTDDKMLVGLYSANRHVYSALSALDAHKHQQLITAFSDAKKKLTQPQTQGA